MFPILVCTDMQIPHPPISMTQAGVPGAADGGGGANGDPKAGDGLGSGSGSRSCGCAAGNDDAAVAELAINWRTRGEAG